SWSRVWTSSARWASVSLRVRRYIASSFPGDGSYHYRIKLVRFISLRERFRADDPRGNPRRCARSQAEAYATDSFLGSAILAILSQEAGDSPASCAMLGVQNARFSAAVAARAGHSMAARRSGRVRQ